jgi:hypothetical protein
MSATVRVYVNGRGIDAPADGAPIDAVRRFDPALADAIVAGNRLITDSRGLPVAAGDPLYHGAIFRVIANRPRHASRAATGDAAPPDTAAGSTMDDDADPASA